MTECNADNLNQHPDNPKDSAQGGSAHDCSSELSKEANQAPPAQTYKDLDTALGAQTGLGFPVDPKLLSDPAIHKALGLEAAAALLGSALGPLEAAADMGAGMMLAETSEGLAANAGEGVVPSSTELAQSANIGTTSGASANESLSPEEISRSPLSRRVEEIVNRWQQPAEKEIEPQNAAPQESIEPKPTAKRVPLNADHDQIINTLGGNNSFARGAIHALLDKLETFGDVTSPHSPTRAIEDIDKMGITPKQLGKLWRNVVHFDVDQLLKVLRNPEQVKELLEDTGTSGTHPPIPPPAA